MNREPSGIFDDRADAYKVSGDLLVGIAKAHFDLTIDPLTHGRWREAMAIMREIDTHADNDDIDPEQVLDELSDYSIYAESYPLLSPTELGKPLHEKVVGRVDTILAIGAYASQNTSLDQYIELRVNEAYETIEILGDLASSELTENKIFTQHYLPAIFHLGAAATLWDSIIDGPRDYRHDELSIKPNPRYYRELSKGVVEHGRASQGALFHVAPLAAIARKGVARAINRARNGMTDYTTLRVLGRR